jgi:hypothetical protein
MEFYAWNSKKLFGNLWAWRFASPPQRLGALQLISRQEHKRVSFASPSRPFILERPELKTLSSWPHLQQLFFKHSAASIEEYKKARLSKDNLA